MNVGNAWTLGCGTGVLCVVITMYAMNVRTMGLMLNIKSIFKSLQGPPTLELDSVIHVDFSSTPSGLGFSCTTVRNALVMHLNNTMR